MTRLVSLLRACEHLSRLPDDDVDRLAEIMTVQDFEAGAALIEEGAPSDAAYLLISGSIQVTRRRQDGGPPDVLAEVHAGELIGLVGLADGGTRSASCVAARPVSAARLDRDALERLTASDPRLAYRMSITVAEQLAETARSVSDRLAAMAAAARGG